MIDDLTMPILILSNQRWQVVAGLGNQLVLRRPEDGALKSITTDALVQDSAQSRKPAGRSRS